MRKSLRIILWIFVAMFMSGAACFAWIWQNIPFGDVELERVTRIDGSPALYDADGKLFHVRLSPDSEWQIVIPLSEMGAWLPKIAVGVEDGRFYTHHGIDLLAITRAAFQNLTSGRVVSGASTITSQVIRMAISERDYTHATSESGARHRRNRNFATKVREFVMALKLERALGSAAGKNTILEQYLNRAPFGGNIRGVQAASMIYFGKPASRLSPGEACLLIGMLKSPTHYRPDTQPEAARERRDLIIRLMTEKNILTPEESRRALLEDLPTKRAAPPMRAWHFAELFFRKNTGGSQGAIHTSLKLEMQSKLEAILRQSVRELPANITIAAGVVDNRTAQLVAWVGNARFNLTANRPTFANASWVDCGIAPRSPGSTLKPFAYLSAIEQGLLTPSSLLADTPGAFLGRAPRNFDLQYRGAVTARVALSESLNAPAVRVLRMAGQDQVLRLLRDLGLRHVNEQASYYGDSLILGGCDVTVLEELEAFTTLASLGVHRPIHLINLPDLSDTEVATEPEARELASQAACWIINDILNYRGQLAVFARGTLGQKWQVALKTGTSYGLRDAWTAAWTPDLTTVVWVGAPDGSSWPGLVGATAAAPVAVRILRTLSPSSGWYAIPDDLEQRRVCSLSGLPPTAACPSTRLEWAVKDISRTLPCNLHTIKAGQTQILWPEEMRTGQAAVKSNGSGSGTSTFRRSANLTITSPIEGATYLTAPFDQERRIPMKAEGALFRVFWYLDGNYIGTSLPGETFFHSIPDGTHDIGAADTEGRSAHTTVKVMTPGRVREQDSAPLLNGR